MNTPLPRLAGCLAALVLSCLPMSATDFTLLRRTLSAGGLPVLESMSDSFATVPDPTGTGVFLSFTAAHSGSYLQAPLGTIHGLRRFTCCHRYEPFWMKPAAGTGVEEVPAETQWLLAETDSGACVMLVPLIDAPFRFALRGEHEGLVLCAETGDPFVAATGGVALFVATGTDPYKLAADGARAVMAHLGTGRLRAEKPLPDFVDSFGWCTWDAFYRDVSPDKVRLGLKSFADGRVEPRFLILDDGWQSTRVTATGEERLTSFEPNERFDHDLAPLVAATKHDFKIRTFIVWQTLYGYWGGVDGDALPGYGVRDVARSFGLGILQHAPIMNFRWWGPLVGVVAPDRIGKFLDDYHRRLAAQGVDGVKVDSQATIEGVASGLGGRVPLTRAYREALEASANTHFAGRLINCMSNGMETYYGSPRSTLIRSSIDFWPRKPETHGAHLYCNAQVGLWFGEFMQPDWDMFQSGHPMGSFHAAGRAVSGGPVYVSDKPDAHDFALLRKLVLSDGSVLRADRVGRPTRDCLFADVTREPVLLKVFNYNRDCAVIGVFNANHHGDGGAAPAPLAGTVSPADAPDLAGSEFAAYAQQSGRVWRCSRGDRAPVALPEGGWEIVSFAPADRGVAVLGLADKLNSTGAVTAKRWNPDGSLTVSLRDGGTFLAWAGRRPQTAEAAGTVVPFEHDAASGRLTANVPAGKPIAVTLRW